ncbi:MAG: hypothetical protein JSR97_12470 [Verrucomicrobia bacterium]|nr:hypothetical protein [Verrucomicrobiota bacterium]
METYKMQSGNTAMGFISGIIGGIGSFLLDIKIGLMSDMLVAILTATLCGAAGVAGKEAYQFLKRKIKTKWNSKSA